MKISLVESRTELGMLAAHDIGIARRGDLRDKAKSLSMILAAAPSQREMLEALLREPGIDWSRVTAFHMDESIGLPAAAPQRFSLWLTQTFFNHLLRR